MKTITNEHPHPAIILPSGRAFHLRYGHAHVQPRVAFRIARDGKRRHSVPHPVLIILHHSEASVELESGTNTVNAKTF